MQSLNTKALRNVPFSLNDISIIIDVSQQILSLVHNTSDGSTSINHSFINQYEVSTAKSGTGSIEGSGCTPLGQHKIAAKIGTSMPINSVFIGRVPTGELYTPKLAQLNPDRDWILSRIIWLAGCEPGLNQGKNDRGVCDTYTRYIYIHGTPDTEPMGVPLSHGCIRMRNQDIIELYDLVDINTPVLIIEG